MVPRLFIALLALSSSVYAGDWHSDADARYQLTVADKHYVVTATDQRWAESLAKNLKRRGGLIRSWEIAPAYPTSTLQLNDAPTNYQVFGMNHSRYLVLSQGSDAADFLVDFGTKAVLAIGGIQTTTIHRHPSGHFVVLIYSHDPLVYGIPISEYSTAVFEDHRAQWLGGEP
jgi:hypothetical protein